MNQLSESASYLSNETRWHGNHEESGRHHILNAGRLSMVYENGNLRYISMGNHEIIRMIYSAVRDKVWLTIKPVISGEEIDIRPNSFYIKYNCLYKSENINFFAQYTIEGKPDNSIILSFGGEAINEFLKNRIGFCVLHPVEGCSGKSCLITHTNGDNELLTFPAYITPQQPFRDIRSMKWKINESDCSLVFDGDIFETEDQRNWTDASYKTYCTPLNLPFPVNLQKGEKISQKIELKVEDTFEYESEAGDEIVINIYPDKISGIPLIGIGKSTRPEPLTDSEVQILKELRFDHYRVDLYLFRNDWKAPAEISLNEALRLGYSVEFALFFDDNYVTQASEFIGWMADKRCNIALINIFHKSYLSTPDHLTDEIAQLIKKAMPGTNTGCGTNANFAQLNRKRPKSAHNDYICYSIHPQEHESDNTTLVENLRGQRYTVESSLQFANSMGIWISPVNIQRRFNANTDNYEQDSDGNDMPPQVDTRLMSLFGACWTAGSLKYLCESGVSGITFFETVGERGIIQGDFQSRWPDKFHSFKEMIFPTFFIFKYLLNHKTYRVIKSECSHSLKVDILTITDGIRINIILVNFTSSGQNVIINGCAKEFSVRQLNTGNYSQAISDCDWIENTQKISVRAYENLFLHPFSVSFIDGWLRV